MKINVTSVYNYVSSQIFLLAYCLFSIKVLSNFQGAPVLPPSPTQQWLFLRQAPSLVSFLLKYSLSILPFKPGASWSVPHSVHILMDGSKSITASYFPQNPNLLLFARSRCTHWEGSYPSNKTTLLREDFCHKDVLSVLVLCLTLQYLIC